MSTNTSEFTSLLWGLTMWKIQRPSFGFVLSLGGKLDAAEVKVFGASARDELAKPLPDGWGVVVDMREMSPLDAPAQEALVDVQKSFKARGMVRSVVILNDAITTMQQRRLARTSGIDKWERYINASAVSDWQSAAKHWVASGAEPPV
jgi:anti-anti-sigma regulatory factor